MPLTEKQKAFVAEYLVDLNATQAARRAGYSEKTAHVIAHENLSKPEIQSEIAKAQEERSIRTGITQDRVLQELARIGFSDLRKVMASSGNLLEPQEWDDDTAPFIASMEIVTKPGGLNADGQREVEHVAKIKAWDKVSALEKMGKHLGMFTDRIDLSARTTVVLESDAEDL
jgi:phage terminase small subunit